MATTAHIDGLRPLSQPELASLLRQRRAESLATRPQKKPTTGNATLNLRQKGEVSAPVRHLALTEKASRELYVRPKESKQTPVTAENWLQKELKQLELWLPELRTHMRQEVQFVRRSWFVSGWEVCGLLFIAGTVFLLGFTFG